MPALLAAPHMVLSEPLHLGFPAVLLARALMMPLLLSPVEASDKARSEASPRVLLPQAADLLDRGPRLPMRDQLDRGEAGVLDHLEVSDISTLPDLLIPSLTSKQASVVLHSALLRTQHRMLPPPQLPPGSVVLLGITLVAGGAAGS